LKDLKKFRYKNESIKDIAR